VRFTLAAAAALACLIAFPLAAQQTTASRATSRASDEGSLSEVLVTARRREENIQDVPAAVSAISGAQLDASYTVNPQEISLLVPSLYYNSANPRNTAYTIRGLGSNTLSISAANDGIEPGVGFYVDQVYHGRPATAAFDFTDIERVEVLRGPQGTLFGKNTTAGAIHIISREPTFEPEGNAEASVGNYHFLQAKGVISGGLIGDVVAGRLAAQITRRDGVICNVSTGERENALNNVAARGQLLFVPTDTLKLRLIADISNLDSACCTQNYLRVGKSLRSPSRQFPALAAGLGYAPPSTDVYDRLTDIDAPLHVKTQDGGVSLIADWNLGATTLTSVSAWRYWQWDVANDRDYTGIPIQLVQRIPSRQDQYSQELRLASNGNSRLRYIGGLYFHEQRITGTPISIYGPAAAYWLLSPSNFSVPIPRNLLDGYGQTGTSDFDLKSYAAFGEANYDITDKITATLGLRYTYEEKEGSYATQVFGGLNLTGFPAATAAELNRAKLSIFRPQSHTAADNGGSASGRANIAYKLTDRLLTYVSYAQGYKSGGLNMSGLPLDAKNNPALATAVIKDERNRTFEVGLKSTLLEGRATANLAAYHTRVKDYQANIVSSTETAAIRSYPANIPEVRVEGVEGDFVALLLKGFTLRASFAYADGKNTNYPAGPCPLEVQTSATVACNLTGVSLAGLSRWTGSLGFDYEHPLAGGALLMHTDVSTRSNYNSDTSASVYTEISGYTLTNASIGFRFPLGLEVDVFARNLFDRNYITALTIQTGNSGLILGQPSDPRLVGVTLRVRF
jgi:iron complex outermembrane receptor protein